MNSWPLALFTDVLKPVSRPELVVSTTPYRILGMRWYAKGLYIKEEKSGSQIRAKELYRVEEGDFVYNRLFAWKGSFGIADAEVSGGYVSGEFPCFTVITEKAEPEYILFYLSQEKIWNDIARRSIGQTNISRLRLKVPDFLSMEIPLPPLEVQRRILGRIERLSLRIEQALRIRKEALIELEQLVDATIKSLVHRNRNRWEFGLISEFAEINPSRRGQIDLDANALVSFVPMNAVDDVSGVIKKPESRRFVDVSSGYKWFIDGDVIFARITPCMENGKAALAKNLNNATGFGSTEFHVMRPGPRLLGEWLHLIVRQHSFRQDAVNHFKGTAGQQRVPRSFLDQKMIPIPPLDEQRKLIIYFDDLQFNVSALRVLHREMRLDLSQLMPSLLEQAFDEMK